MLYETIAVSLFGRFPMPALLAATTIVTCTVTLARLLVLCSSPLIFEEKRDCLHCSYFMPEWVNCINNRQAYHITKGPSKVYSAITGTAGYSSFWQPELTVGLMTVRLIEHCMAGIAEFINFVLIPFNPDFFKLDFPNHLLQECEDL